MAKEFGIPGDGHLASRSHEAIAESLRKRMLPGVRDEAGAYLRVHPAVAECLPELMAML